MTTTTAPSRAHIETRLAEANHQAKRAQHHVDCAQWRMAHAMLDRLLTQWQACDGEATTPDA